MQTTREIAVRTYNELIKTNNMFNTPIIWVAWKRAFDSAEREFKKQKP
jgi:hypothetical protein